VTWTHRVEVGFAMSPACLTAFAPTSKAELAAVMVHFFHHGHCGFWNRQAHFAAFSTVGTWFRRAYQRC
jgi:hypothetical protein